MATKASTRRLIFAVGCVLLQQCTNVLTFSRFAPTRRCAAGALLLGLSEPARAQSVMYNAQLGGDLNEAQKKKIKEYLAKQPASSAPIATGDHTMKLYHAPSDEELTPGSPAFKARVAQVAAELARVAPERAVPASQAVEMMKKGAVLVDVRTREQIQSQTKGRIPQGAMVLPLDDWVGRLPPVMAGKKIVLTCWKGNKSLLAWEALRSQFADAYVMEGGYNAWEAAGLATESI